MAALTSAADIPPGGEGEIKATVHTKGRSGLLAKTIAVETSDPENKRVRLKLQAKVLVEVDLDPKHVNLGRLGKGEVVTKTSKLVAREPDKVKLVSVEVDSEEEQLKAKIVPLDGGQGVEVFFKATKIGAIRGRLKVKTTSEKLPELQMVIRGTVLGNWELTPRTVSFTEPDGGDEGEAKRTIKVSARKQSRYKIIKAVDVEEGAVKAKVIKNDDGFEIELTLLKVPEKRRGIIKITTNDPDERELEARYYVRRKRSQQMEGRRRAPFKRPPIKNER